MDQAKTLEITLGDLIVALTEETAPVVSDRRARHRVVSYMVAELFRTEQVTFKNRHNQGGEEQRRARSSVVGEKRCLGGRI